MGSGVAASTLAVTVLALTDAAEHPPSTVSGAPFQGQPIVPFCFHMCPEALSRKAIFAARAAFKDSHPKEHVHPVVLVGIRM